MHEDEGGGVAPRGRGGGLLVGGRDGSHRYTLVVYKAKYFERPGRQGPARWQADALGSIRWRTQWIYRWRMTSDGEYHRAVIDLDFPRVSIAVVRFLRAC